MADLVMYSIPIFIVGFIVLGIYKMLELSARKKEREMFIEKLASLSELKEDDANRLKDRLPFIVDSGYGFWPLRISLLLIGIGAGCLFAFFMRIQYPNMSWDLISLANTAFILFFGGIGLLVAYFIEQKKRAENENKKS